MAARASGLSGRTALPITTRSGRAPSASSRLPGPKPSTTGIPHSESAVLMGGYRPRSDPVTRMPRAATSPASEPIPVPPTAMKWTQPSSRIPFTRFSSACPAFLSGVTRLSSGFHPDKKASMMRSWTSGRSSKRLRLATRCTRLVSITTMASRSRSIQSDVPVKPRCPTDPAEKCWPEEDMPGLGVSQPRAQSELWGMR